MNIEAKTILTPEDIKPTKKLFRVRGVLNPAAVRLKNNKIMLFARIAETPFHGKKEFLAPRFSGEKELKWTIEKLPRHGNDLRPDCFIVDSDVYRLPTISHFRKVIMDENGFDVQSINTKPDFFGLKNDGDFGVEDPRITFLKKEKRYLMTYVSVSMNSGVSTSLATSKNLTTWKRKGIIFRQQNKDVVIFPEKINGYYVALHRPEGNMIFDKPSIWISYSKDLIFWGKEKPLLKPRRSGWDSLRIGPGAIPIKTNEGWLEIYHGVTLENPKDNESPKIYTTGALLFDLKNPEKIIARTPTRKPLFGTDLKSESKGFISNVVFSTAIIPTLDKKNVLIYGGASDSNVTVRKINLKQILNSLK